MEQFKQKFIEEANDLIQDLESSCLILSSEPDNQAHVETIFRAMHSLKGGSAMFGFDMIDACTHQLETAYDMVRSGAMKVDDKLLDISFKVIDHVKDLLEENDNLSESTLQNHSQLLIKISEIVNVDDSKTKDPEHSSSSAEETYDNDINTYYIKFVPNRDIFRNGTNPLLIINELVSLGENKVYSFVSEIPVFEKIDATHCYTHWVVLLATNATKEDIQEVFMFVDVDCEVEINNLGSNLSIKEADLIEIDSEYENGADLTADLILSHLEPIVKSESISDNIEVEEKKNNIKNHSISSIRVSSEKLDELINLVSELVTRQASLSLLAENLDHKDLNPISEDIDKISRRLRDSTFSIRLIPIENMVTRFRRLVRELSADFDKNIDFITEGTDTELDKSIIEGLLEPIMHIIRNNIDHGLESVKERKALGKPENGTILLKAFYSGANVYIQLSDDGRGIDVEKIRRKGINLGHIPEDAAMSDKEILDMIFLPGFSTTTKVTSVSGRGVGMDIVKRKVTELKGEVSIDTEKDVGTTMTIKLPLTLSIIDGLLVMIDDTHYVIPLATARKCFDFSHKDLTNAVNNLIYIDDHHIPFANLRTEFGINTEPPEREQIVAIEYNGSDFGLAIDHIVGEYQAVLKSLGSMYRDQEIISGATILGDGTVALVLDPHKIISQFKFDKGSKE